MCYCRVCACVFQQASQRSRSRARRDRHLHFYGAPIRKATGVSDCGDSERVARQRSWTKHNQLIGLNETLAISLNSYFFFLVVTMGGSSSHPSRLHFDQVIATSASHLLQRGHSV